MKVEVRFSLTPVHKKKKKKKKCSEEPRLTALKARNSTLPSALHMVGKSGKTSKLELQSEDSAPCDSGQLKKLIPPILQTGMDFLQQTPVRANCTQRV